MNINLITEEEVHLILTSLPQLKKLNGKEIKITEERDINGIVDYRVYNIMLGNMVLLT